MRIKKRDNRISYTELEKNIFNEFKSSALPYINSLPRDDFGWLAIAQHYGLPTRLLDWSVNPLVALWFAVKDPLDIYDSNEALVWAFETKETDNIDISKSPFEQSYTKVFQPEHNTQRVIAQSGRFTIQRINEEDKSVSLERNRKFKDRLHIFKIEKVYVPYIRLTLDRLGINSASMKPDLDGICSNIKWKIHA